MFEISPISGREKNRHHPRGSVQGRPPKADTGGMTAPRRILNDTTWLLTRRCSERRFFLLPSATVTQVFEYALARAAATTGVELHAWMCMSNHYHMVVTDPHGALPVFMKQFNSLVARMLNRCYGRRESFWSPGSYSAVELLAEDVVLNEIVYSLVNPVKAGLVRTVDEWQGSHSLGLSFGDARLVERPEFLKKGNQVEELRLTRPRMFEQLTESELEALIRARVRGSELDLARQREEAKQRVVGMQKIRRQHWNSSPRTTEVKGRTRPRFAAHNAAVFAAAMAEWKLWLIAYVHARDAFCNGDRDVEFPLGTFLMRVRFNVATSSITS